MFDASVIICTHNPQPQYLRRVLESLRHQTHSFNRWELLLIDNASKEALTPKSLDMSWHPHARHIREDTLGLSSARIRGMRESSANLLVFVDDDNLLDESYLSEAIRIESEWPQLGVWGAGVIVPEFEVQPADNLRDFLENLPLRKIDTCRWSNVISCQDVMPWGAGQCVRASVAKAYREHFDNSSIKITGRQGNDLESGEDIEIDYVACSIGRGVGIFPELRIVHLIPRNRIEEDYLVREAEGSLIATFLLDFKWRKIVPASPFSGLGMLRILKYILYKKRIHRRMYLALVRATLQARRIILANGAEPQE